MRIRQKEIRRARKRHEERIKEARKNGTIAQAPAARAAQTRTLTARPAAAPSARGARGDRGPRGDNRGGDNRGGGDRGGRGPRPEGGANRPPRENRGGANPAEAIVNTEGAGGATTPTGEATA